MTWFITSKLSFTNKFPEEKYVFDFETQTLASDEKTRNSIDIPQLQFAKNIFFCKVEMAAHSILNLAPAWSARTQWDERCQSISKEAAGKQLWTTKTDVYDAVAGSHWNQSTSWIYVQGSHHGTCHCDHVGGLHHRPLQHHEMTNDWPPRWIHLAPPPPEPVAMSIETELQYTTNNIIHAHYW